MSSECNGTTSSTSCQTDPIGSQPLLVPGSNGSMSDVTQGFNVGNATAGSEVESTVWVPYLSLICLLIVSVTLSLSFLSHWKRVKRRRTNLQDYLDHDIDLNRKRLYGMMRMPYDLDRALSFSRSLDDPRNFSSMKLRYKFERQYSYDSFSPHKDRNVLQRGGFQRNESTSGPMPSIRIDGEKYRSDECCEREKGSLDSKESCHHHCVVSCRLCWKSLRSELFTLLKSCIDDFYRKRDREHSIKNQYETPSNERSTDSGIESIKKSTQNFRFEENNRDQWMYRSPESRKEEERSFMYNEPSPRRHSRERGNILRRQKMTEGSNATDLDHRRVFRVSDNRLTYSDSELLGSRLKQKSPLDSNAYEQRSKHASGTRINIDVPDVISSKQSFNEPSFDGRFSHDAPAERTDVGSVYQTQNGTTSVRDATNKSQGTKISSLTTSAGDDIRIMPQIGSPYLGSMEPVSHALQDRGAIYRMTPSGLPEGTGGIINYGFQSDSMSSPPDLYGGHSRFTDIAPMSRMNAYHQRTDQGHDDTAAKTPSKGKPKRKKPLLKSLKQFDLMTSSHKQSSDECPDREMIDLQSRHPSRPQDHKIDLSVIDVNYYHFSEGDGSHGNALNDPFYSSIHQDVDV